jgi:4a-hydroxytetrahydrobiopterin dehydratase
MPVQLRISAAITSRAGFAISVTSPRWISMPRKADCSRCLVFSEIAWDTNRIVFMTLPVYQEGNDMTKTTNNLDEAAIASLLADLPGWQKIEGREAISVQYELPDFLAVMSLMAQIAPEAEALKHHPEWSNVYNRLTVTLTTHDTGGITSLDAELARLIDARASVAGATTS